ncbi:hypothetical protein [Psychrobacter sp. DM4]|uniref:hypothetical protein n=1 Tax=Psychrobacter sp. DM4 TaxID=3440637 RepID=UPI003F4FA69D
MNKSILLIVIIYSLTGCASINTNSNDSLNYAAEGKDLPSGIFTYYDKPSSIYLPVDYVTTGKLIIDNNCLLLQTESGIYTPVFPAKYTKYQESNTEIVLYGRSIKIGETAEIPAVPRDRRNIGMQKIEGEPYYVTKGQPHCLDNDLMKIERW